MRRVETVVTHIVLLVATWLAAPAVADPLPKVALIIDDVGYRLAEGERAVRLPGAVAVAVAVLAFVVGVSNHMGSLLTQQADHIGWLMDELRRREPLFFVDSYTTAASVGFAAAREYGVPTLVPLSALLIGDAR